MVAPQARRAAALDLEAFKRRLEAARRLSGDRDRRLIYPRSAMTDSATPLRPRRRDAVLRGARRPFLRGRRVGPAPAPDLPRARPGRRPTPADPLPDPVLGRPDDLRPGARPPAAADAPRAVRDRAGRARSLAGPHARRRRRARPAGRRRRGARALFRDGRRGDAQPRLSTRSARPAGRLDPGDCGRPVRTGPTTGRATRRERTARRQLSDDGRAEPDRDAPPDSGARPSTARPRTRATGSSPPTTPRSRPTSRPRSRRRPRPLARRPPGRRHDRPSAGHGRRPRLRQPVRPTDRAPRPRARRLLRAAAARHADMRRSSGAAPGRSSCRAARTRSTTPDAPAARPGRSGPGASRSSGICYGAQLMAHELGGDVMAADHREYGPANVTITARGRRCSAGSSASSRSG